MQNSTEKKTKQNIGDVNANEKNNNNKNNSKLQNNNKIDLMKTNKPTHPSDLITTIIIILISVQEGIGHDYYISIKHCIAESKKNIDR